MMLFLLFLVISALSFAQQVTFQKTYGSSTNDDCWDIVKSKGGDYLLAGSQLGDVFVMNMDLNGDTTWTSRFGGIESESAFAISHAAESGYMVTGNTYSWGAGGNGDGFAVKINASGTPLWSKTFGGIYGDDITDFCVGHNNNGYLFAGSTASFGSAGAEWDIYLIRTDNNGDTLWTRSVGGIDGDYCHAIDTTFDGDFIITGYTQSFGAGQADAYIMKLNSSGDVLWFKTYGDLEDDIGLDIMESTDGDYLVCGRTDSFGSSDGDLLIFKTNSNGDLLWTKRFGAFGTDLARGVFQTNSGDIMVVGETYSMGAGLSDAFLIQLDSAGNYVWGKAYGDTSFDYGRAVVPDNQQGYVIAALSSSYGTSLDAYMIKTNSIGESGCNEQSIFPIETEPVLQVQPQSVNSVATSSLVTIPNLTNLGGTNVYELCGDVGIEHLENTISANIYPNPATDHIIVETNGIEGVDVVIAGVDGKVILSKHIASSSTSMDLKNIATGLYTVLLVDSGRILYSEKLVVN